MKRVGRREFAKAVGTIAAALPFLTNASAEPLPEQFAGAPKMPAARLARDLVLTAEQQTKLSEAIAQRNAQLALLHARALPYELEPAFVFRVRQAPRSGRKP